MIPTDPEYIPSPEDDGKVVIRSLVYPDRIRHDPVWNSSNHVDTIPRNYMANLTYDCGSARKFIKPDGTQIGKKLKIQVVGVWI